MKKLENSADSLARLFDSANSRVRPILKWAGGKQQLLPRLLPKVPDEYTKYIVPFLGGGALFFALRPINAVIADSNPELINLYRITADSVEALIDILSKLKTDREDYYKIRNTNPAILSDIEKAARTIYLNRTCFNGLYRVNRQGRFNVPYGRHKNPRICFPDELRAASEVIKRSTILCADYRDVLTRYAAKGDFIFLDPPYLPVSQYSDFKRYTAEQFYEEDHVKLAEEVVRLHGLGCHIILTNSNHPLVHELYGQFPIEVVPTRRNISKNGNNRTGEDVIIKISPKESLNFEEKTLFKSLK
jgi:DNA adenine methylase